MRALVHDEYGTPDVVRLEDIPVPLPGPGDVLVRVRAASLNAIDLDYLYGRPAIARLGTGIRRPRDQVLGVDAAGEVDAVGPGVTALLPGDRVYGDLSGHGQGAFAEFACAPESAWARPPANLSFEEAAAIPQSAVLAIQGLQGPGRPIEPGDRVLINGASGNVGPFAVQLAKVWGAHVTGVCSPDKADFVRSLGADEVLDYTRVDYTRSRRRWDRILDMVGKYPVTQVRHALATDGTYVTLGGPGRRIAEALVVGPLISFGSRRRMGLMLWWKPFAPADVAALAALLEDGRIRPVIDRTWPLEDGQTALRYLDERRARGKVVLVP